MGILIETEWDNQHARRLVKRLKRHQEDLLTFMHQDNVPFDNNHAKRSIRPAVIIRKNSYGNRNEKGIDCQAALMGVLRTLKQRGHDPIRTVVQAIEQYFETGKLPPLPPRTTSDGCCEKLNSSTYVAENWLSMNVIWVHLDW